MPYVNVKITREGGGPSAAQKAAVIDEVPLESWGIGGLPVLDYRKAAR